MAKVKSGFHFDTVKLRQFWLRHRIKLSITTVLLVVLGGLLWFFLLQPAQSANSSANAMQENLQAIAGNAAALEIDQVRYHLDQSQLHLEEMQSSVARLGWLKFVPWASTQLRAIEEIADIAENLLTHTHGLLDAFTPFLNQMTGVVDESAIAPQLDGTPEGNGAEFGPLLLSGLKDSQREIDLLKSESLLAQLKLERLLELPLHSKLRGPVEMLLGRLEQLNTSIAGVGQAFDFLPLMLGDQEPRTFLLAIQNNTELRPTGGFWGNYGLLTIDQGQIGDIETYDIYRIDNDPQARAYGYPIPYPLGSYLQQRELHLRDSGWWPDVPTSAEVMLDFYEFLTDDRLEDLILVDPIVIEDLLTIFGPLDIPEQNLTVTAENVTYETQYQVHHNVVSMETRKDFVGVLGEYLMARMLSASAEEMKQVFAVLMDNLAEKHIQLYARTPAIQDFYCSQNWCGQIASTTDEDFLLTVEANIGINKANFFVDRSTSYTVTKREDGRLESRVEFTLNNPEGFGWPGGPYTNYLRVYVPSGSELIAHQGYHVAPQTLTEFAGTDKEKTVFGGIVRVNVRSSQTVVLRYLLPERVAADEYYQLIWQKQAGTPTIPGQTTYRGDPVRFAFVDPNEANWRPVDPDLAVEDTSGGQLILSGDLAIDRLITLVR